jgi:hypothetical protein
MRTPASSQNNVSPQIDFKYDLPNNCKLEIQRLNRIEKLDDDYILAAHPYPQMDGEMILF